MLSDRLEKVKYLYEEHKTDIYIALLIFFVGLGSFGLGRLSVLWPQKEPITIEKQEAGIMNYGTGDRTNRATKSAHDSKFLIPDSGKYVASKNGTAYHFPWCPGAQKIKEENKMFFDTTEAAKAAGYKPAGNCPGL